MDVEYSRVDTQEFSEKFLFLLVPGNFREIFSIVICQKITFLVNYVSKFELPGISRE